MTDVDTVELKPCPLCGSTASIDWEDAGPNANKSNYFISCDGGNCIIRTRGCYGSLCDGDVEAWNTRSIAALPPAVPALLLERTFAIEYNPNCPSPWLVRLIGKGAFLDLKRYSSFTPESEFTGDILGFGKTIDEAAQNAIEGGCNATPDPVAEAAKVLLAEYPHGGWPVAQLSLLGVHWQSPDEAITTALRALTKDGEAG